MPNADRAAVAREVLAELVETVRRLASAVDDWRHLGPTEENSDSIDRVVSRIEALSARVQSDGVLSLVGKAVGATASTGAGSTPATPSAPAAPVTVTVETRRGVSVEWTRKEQGSWQSNHYTWVPSDHIASELFDRIAADAQVIAAKDKRIAELEREVEELRDDARTADDARGNLLLQTICRLPDVLTTGDWQEWLDEHRHQWLNDDRAFGGWVAERLSAHMTRVERERDEAGEAARLAQEGTDAT